MAPKILTMNVSQANYVQHTYQFTGNPVSTSGVVFELVRAEYPMYVSDFQVKWNALKQTKVVARTSLSRLVIEANKGGQTISGSASIVNGQPLLKNTKAFIAGGTYLTVYMGSSQTSEGDAGPSSVAPFHTSSSSEVWALDVEDSVQLFLAASDTDTHLLAGTVFWKETRIPSTDYPISNLTGDA